MTDKPMERSCIEIAREISFGPVKQHVIAWSASERGPDYQLIADFIEEALQSKQKTIEDLRAEVERKHDALANFGAHERDCILAQWNQGRPTANGGYETEYGYGTKRKWYQNKPVDETPKCECGLDEALSLPLDQKEEK